MIIKQTFYYSVNEEEILPFGKKDNLWEMRMFGPCGPCTETHNDRLSRPYPGEKVNLGVEDLMQLWNIVFIIQYSLRGMVVFAVVCKVRLAGLHQLERVMHR